MLFRSLSFREQFLLSENESSRNAELKQRLLPVCQRTLRRQVLEYIKFTQRIPLTWEFHPSEAEQKLYEGVSTYLQREVLYALPNAQRTLMTMVLRKLLASSSFAIAKTLRGLLDRLQKKRAAVASASAVAEDSDAAWIPDYESFGETSDEWEGDEVVATTLLELLDRVLALLGERLHDLDDPCVVEIHTVIDLALAHGCMEVSGVGGRGLVACLHEIGRAHV